MFLSETVTLCSRYGRCREVYAPKAHSYDPFQPLALESDKSLLKLVCFSPGTRLLTQDLAAILPVSKVRGDKFQNNLNFRMVNTGNK